MNRFGKDEAVTTARHQSRGRRLEKAHGWNALRYPNGLKAAARRPGLAERPTSCGAGSELFLRTHARGRTEERTHLLFRLKN